MRSSVFGIIFLLASQSFAFSLIGDGIKGFASAEISIDYNQASCPAGFDIASLVAESIEIWNEVPGSKLKLSLGSESTATALSYPPVAYCDSTMTGSTAGQGQSAWDTSLTLVLGRLRFNTNPAAAGYVLNLPKNAQLIISAHEVGHVLGFGHSNDSFALMYWQITGQEEFNLGQDDMDAVTYLYPRDELKGDKMLGGCAMVSSVKPPPPWQGALLLLPVAFYLFLNRRRLVSRRF